MKRIRYCIGIDVSKNWLDIAILHCGNNVIILEFKIGNTLKDLFLLKKKFRSHRIIVNKATLVCFEHGGFYSRVLLNFLLKQKCLICIESALQIKRSLGVLRGKSDTIDSRRIAEYAFRNIEKLRIWKNPRLSILRLKDLLTLRDRLVRTRTAIQTPVVELKRFYSIQDFKRLMLINEPALSGIQNSLVCVSNEIKNLISSDSEINRLINLLTSVPGIGPITALYLITSTNEFSITDSGKRLASYMGVAPFEYSSGSSVRGKRRVSKIANKKMKGLIHAGAASTIRRNGAYRNYYERKIGEGKHKMSVINAVCNKILRRASAVIKRGTPYIKEKSSCPPSKATALDS